MRSATPMQKNLEGLVEQLLKEFDLNRDDPNLKDTPRRVAKSFLELFEGLYKETEIESILSKTFPCTYDEMVVIRDVKTASVCPHHLLPVELVCHVGYVPEKQVLGLSKVPRLIELLAHRPVLQEQLTDDIASKFMKHVKPRGVMCVVQGIHSCMRIRGIKSPNSTVTTSSVKGIFHSNDKGVKDEFLRVIYG